LSGWAAFTYFTAVADEWDDGRDGDGGEPLPVTGT
jgi:hypothetical protein